MSSISCPKSHTQTHRLCYQEKLCGLSNESDKRKKNRTRLTVTSAWKKSLSHMFPRQTALHFKRTIMDRVKFIDVCLTDDPELMQEAHMYFWQSHFSRDGRGTETLISRETMNKVVDLIKTAVGSLHASQVDLPITAEEELNAIRCYQKKGFRPRRA